MQTAAAAVAMAAAWQTQQRATCDSTRLWRRQLGQVFRTATSAVFFLPLPLLLFSIVFSFFCCCFCCFFGEFFSLSVCVCGVRLALRQLPGERFSVFQADAPTQSALCQGSCSRVCVCVCGRVCVPVCVNGNVAYACFFCALSGIFGRRSSSSSSDGYVYSRQSMELPFCSQADKHVCVYVCVCVETGIPARLLDCSTGVV